MAQLARLTSQSSMTKRSEADVVAMSGLAPLVFIGFAILISTAAHGLTPGAALSILLLTGISGAYILISKLFSVRARRLVLLATFAIIAGFALAQVIVSLIASARLIRPTGENVLAPVMLAAIILAMQDGKPRLAACYGLALFVSGSMAGYISALVAALVYILPRFTAKLNGRRALLALSIVGPGAVIYTYGLLGRTHGPPSQRVTVWFYALGLFLNDPYAGAGLGIISQTSPWRLPHAHNLILQVAAELGVVGLLALAGVVWWAVRRAMPRGGMICWPGLALLVGLAAESMLDYIYWVPQASLLILLAFEVICVSGAAAHDAAGASTSEDHQPDTVDHSPD